MTKEEIVVANFRGFAPQIPQNVMLLAVSKTVDEQIIKAVYDEGQRDFAENKVQDLVRKFENLPKDINWHFIGHLQTNKVKQIIPFVTLIHGVDSLRLLATIDKEAHKIDRVVDCLFEMHIATEESKFGLTTAALRDILESDEFAKLKNVRVCGLMGMATFTDETDMVIQEFALLKKYFDDVKKDFFADVNYFKELSMGMSGDYQLAIEAGSTIVRIGTTIFGERR